MPEPRTSFACIASSTTAPPLSVHIQTWSIIATKRVRYHRVEGLDAGQNHHWTGISMLSPIYRARRRCMNIEDLVPLA